MGERTLIEWCLRTCNLWWGCHEVHCGCDHCYARTLAKSKGKGAAWEDMRFAVGSIWKNLEKWQRIAAAAGEMHRVFTGSMMDIGEKSLPAFDWQGNPLGCTTGDLRDRYFREVIPATPNLLHLLLTKRPGNLLKMVPAEWLKDWPANVMSGTSPADQATADILIEQLLRVPGPLFLSVEPLLGRISSLYMGPGEAGEGRLSWVIVGGESGPGARPMNPEWARSIRDQCIAAGVSYFFKQNGEWLDIHQCSHIATQIDQGRYKVGEWHDDGQFTPGCICGAGHGTVVRVGKKLAGRILDGRTWDELPALEPAAS